MERLPESLSQNNLMRLPVPDDVTLGEAKTWAWYGGLLPNIKRMLELEVGREVSPLRLRFMRRDREEEYPDDETIGTFRAENGRVVIDDEGGGLPARQPETV